MISATSIVLRLGSILGSRATKTPSLNESDTLVKMVESILHDEYGHYQES